MTVPQYNLKLSHIFRRIRNRQPTVQIPSYWILVDIPPCVPILLLIAQNTIIIGFLPDYLTRHGLTQFLRNSSFVLTKDHGQGLCGCCGCVPKDNNGVNMIGHDDIFVNGCVGEMLRDFQKKLSGDLPVSIELFCTSEKKLLLMGANGDEIVIRNRIIISWNSVCFAFGMVHDGTSVRIRRTAAEAENWFCGTVITVPYEDNSKRSTVLQGIKNAARLGGVSHRISLSARTGCAGPRR